MTELMKSSQSSLIVRSRGETRRFCDIDELVGSLCEHYLGQAVLIEIFIKGRSRNELFSINVSERGELMDAEKGDGRWFSMSKLQRLWTEVTDREVA